MVERKKVKPKEKNFLTLVENRSKTESQKQTLKGNYMNTNANTAAVETAVEKVENRGRKARFATIEGAMSTLIEIRDATAAGAAHSVSTFHLKQLLAQGYLETTKVETGKRGQPALVYSLNGKTRSRVALWEASQKRKAEKAEKQAADAAAKALADDEAAKQADMTAAVEVEALTGDNELPLDAAVETPETAAVETVAETVEAPFEVDIPQTEETSAAE